MECGSAGFGDDRIFGEVSGGVDPGSTLEMKKLPRFESALPCGVWLARLNQANGYPIEWL